MAARIWVPQRELLVIANFKEAVGSGGGLEWGIGWLGGWSAEVSGSGVMEYLTIRLRLWGCRQRKGHAGPKLTLASLGSLLLPG